MDLKKACLNTVEQTNRYLKREPCDMTINHLNLNYLAE